MRLGFGVRFHWLSFISVLGGGSVKLLGGYVALERYLGVLSHIEKPFEGG